MPQPTNALAPTPVNALDYAVQQQFGLLPNQDRLSILPRYSRATGWVAPEMLYQAARGFVAPSVAAQGNPLTVEDALNTAGAAMGGGMFGSAPKNSLRMMAGRNAKPEINMTRDKAGRVVLTENTNPDILLSAALHPDDPKYISPYLEVLADPAVIGGKGTATRLYLKGLELAKQHNLGWRSDSIYGDATEKMYQRLINMGIPFKKTDDYFEISPEQLSKINLKKIIEK